MGPRPRITGSLCLEQWVGSAAPTPRRRSIRAPRTSSCSCLSACGPAHSGSKGVWEGSSCSEDSECDRVRSSGQRWGTSCMRLCLGVGRGAALEGPSPLWSASSTQSDLWTEPSQRWSCHTSLGARVFQKRSMERKASSLPLGASRVGEVSPLLSSRMWLCGMVDSRSLSM